MQFESGRSQQLELAERVSASGFVPLPRSPPPTQSSKRCLCAPLRRGLGGGNGNAGVVSDPQPGSRGSSRPRLPNRSRICRHPRGEGSHRSAARERSCRH